MKKALVVLLTLLTIVLMTACGSNGIPSDKLIQEDVENALYEKNQLVSLTNVETVKSLQGEGTYEITLNITAESKYADWSYEIDMSYTKYDQGWMLDKSKWVSEDYILARVPSDSEMVELARDFFSTYDDYRLNALDQIEKGVVKIKDTLEDEQIYFAWDGAIRYLHAVENARFASYWSYDSNGDTWTLMSEENPKSYVYCGYKIYKMSSEMTITADFAGTWGFINENPFVISDFTADSFTVSWEGKPVKVYHSTEIPEQWGSIKTNERWYVDKENHYYLVITLQQDQSSIIIYTLSTYGNANMVAVTTVNTELPGLG